MNTGFLGPAVATVLTACGIETRFEDILHSRPVKSKVATVLTACGIETFKFNFNTMISKGCNSTYRLRY